MEYVYLAKHRKSGHDNRLFYAATHDGFEILHILEGHGHFVYNNQYFEIIPGRIFFVNGNRFHYSNPDDPSKYVRNVVEFSQDVLISIFSAIEEAALLDFFQNQHGKKCYVDLSDATNKLIDSIFLDIESELQSHLYGKSLLITADIMRLISLSARDIHNLDYPDTPWSTTDMHVMEVIKYVETHLSDFSLENMERELSMSKYHMCHFFKQATGLTISEYLMAKRMEQARILLTSSDKTIAEIGEKLGFSSFSIFSRNFKKSNGVSPREYRKSHP